ncbi:MAG: hypothetical protein ACC661_07835, partial [Verrucomicrobiales bacterium]
GPSDEAAGFACRKTYTGCGQNGRTEGTPMKVTLPTFLILILSNTLVALSEQQLADYLKRHPDADANREGGLKREDERGSDRDHGIV